MSPADMKRDRRTRHLGELPRLRGKGFARSIRFDRTLAQFLREQELSLDTTIAEVVRGVLDDRRTFFGTPHPQLEKHLADMKALGMTRREYMQFLLSLRYEAIIQGAVDLSLSVVGTKKSRR